MKRSFKDTVKRFLLREMSPDFIAEILPREVAAASGINNLYTEDNATEFSTPVYSIIYTTKLHNGNYELNINGIIAGYDRDYLFAIVITEVIENEFNVHIYDAHNNINFRIKTVDDISSLANAITLIIKPN